MFSGKYKVITPAAVVVLAMCLAAPAFAGVRPDNRPGPHGIGTVARAQVPDAFARAVQRGAQASPDAFGRAVLRRSHTIVDAPVRPDDRAGVRGIGPEASTSVASSSSGGWFSSWPTIGIVAAAFVAVLLSLAAAGLVARRHPAHT
jgi:hypothetical protein